MLIAHSKPLGGKAEVNSGGMGVPTRSRERWTSWKVHYGNGFGFLVSLGLLIEYRRGVSRACRGVSSLIQKEAS